MENNSNERKAGNHMKKIALTTIIAAVVMSASLAGYFGITGKFGSGNGAKSNNVTVTEKGLSGSKGDNTAAGSVKTASEPVGSLIDAGDIFSSRDLNQSPDLTDAKKITVKDDTTYTVNEAGTYVFTGSASDYTVKVDTDSESKVQIVLDNVNITNEDFPVIYVVSADKTFVTTTGTENTLTVTSAFRSDGDINTDAVIYSKDDLVLNGTGTLNITSACGNGISGKDDLKITGGTYNIKSAKDAVEARDSISISDGEFNITTDKDAFHSENDDDNTLGSLYIGGGSFNITAKSDGFQATTFAQIDGGTFTIKASEGVEATYVLINGGDLNITASDDGINATSKSTLYSIPTVEINNGSITIVMGQGDTDAIDANGNIIVNGGTIDITATVSSFDYDGVAEFNGGTIIINGSEVDSIPESMFGGPGQGGGRGGFGGPGQGEGRDGFGGPGQCEGRDGFGGPGQGEGRSGFGGDGQQGAFDGNKGHRGNN